MEVVYEQLENIQFIYSTEIKHLKNKKAITVSPTV